MEIDVSESPLRHLKRDIDWDESEQVRRFSFHVELY